MLIIQYLLYNILFSTTLIFFSYCVIIFTLYRHLVIFMEKYYRIKAIDEFDTVAECRCKYRHCNDKQIPTHCHEFYEIFITDKGSVKHWANGKVQELPEGTLVFIRPDDVHTYVYNPKPNNTTGYINLSFSIDVANNLFSYLSDSFPYKKLLSSSMPPMVILNKTEKKRIISQLNDINALDWNNKTAINLYVKSLLADIFVRHFFFDFSVSNSDYPFWFANLLKEMEDPKNFVAGTKRMIELSKKSRDHLARTVRKYLNLSLTEYINNLRINYAANLLLNSNYSIIDICFLCGFQNLGYFYKVFKKNYDMSPAKFIEKHII